LGAPRNVAEFMNLNAYIVQPPNMKLNHKFMVLILTTDQRKAELTKKRWIGSNYERDGKILKIDFSTLYLVILF
jgi:hypothetical protein